MLKLLLGTGARTGVGGQLAHDLDVAVLALEVVDEPMLVRTPPATKVVDGAHVVQTTAGHHVSRGGVGTGHDP